jgi:hypothetical protein
MNRQLIKHKRIGLVLLTLLLGCYFDANAFNTGKPPSQSISIESTVLAPNESYAGRSQGEWAASWWVWAFSMSEENSPLRDATGRLCATNQEGDVWFLAGVKGGGRVARTCEVPAGKAIFFPLITTLFYANGACKERMADVAASNDPLEYADFELDNVVIHDAAQHRQNSGGCFPLNPTENENPNSGRLATTDGYWIMLRPLPPGEHELKFKAAFNKPGEYFGQMKQDVVYHLRVLAP